MRVNMFVILMKDRSLLIVQRTLGDEMALLCGVVPLEARRDCEINHPTQKETEPHMAHALPLLV